METVAWLAGSEMRRQSRPHWSDIAALPEQGTGQVGGNVRGRNVNPGCLLLVGGDWAEVSHVEGKC